jgi:hypothetical protein
LALRLKDGADGVRPDEQADRHVAGTIAEPALTGDERPLNPAATNRASCVTAVDHQPPAFQPLQRIVWPGMERSADRLALRPALLGALGFCKLSISTRRSAAT